MGSGVHPSLWPPGPRKAEDRGWMPEDGCRGRSSDHRFPSAVLSHPIFEGAWASWGLGLDLSLRERSKPIERLGPVSSTRCRAFTPGLSTWWSTTALGETWF